MSPDAPLSRGCEHARVVVAALVALSLFRSCNVLTALPSLFSSPPLSLRALAGLTRACNTPFALPPTPVPSAQALLASRNRGSVAPVLLSTRPPSDWQDVIVRTAEGVVARVQSWRNGWVRAVPCPRRSLPVPPVPVPVSKPSPSPSTWGRGEMETIAVVCVCGVLSLPGATAPCPGSLAGAGGGGLALRQVNLVSSSDGGALSKRSNELTVVDDPMTVAAATAATAVAAPTPSRSSVKAPRGDTSGTAGGAAGSGVASTPTGTGLVFSVGAGACVLCTCERARAVCPRV